MSLQFSFCESTGASGTSPWHIRALEKDKELHLGGGIDTDSLCGKVRAPSGWDLQTRFSSASADAVHVCRVCRDRYQDYLRIGDLYYAHEGKKYVRMRDIDGLEKQLLDGVAKVEWYILHNPGAGRPFYLLEFAMRRRLNAKSRHWFKPEEFRIHVPEDKVSPQFRAALSSPRSGASSNTGTSSARRAKK